MNAKNNRVLLGRFYNVPGGRYRVYNEQLHTITVYEIFGWQQEIARMELDFRAQYPQGKQFKEDFGIDPQGHPYVKRYYVRDGKLEFLPEFKPYDYS